MGVKLTVTQWGCLLTSLILLGANVCPVSAQERARAR
jgi:hypothetical protein